MRLGVTTAALVASMLPALGAAQTLPGNQVSDPTYAGAIFAEACARSAPSFRQAGTTLAANGFVVAPTGTYYHPQFDLSIRPTDSVACSIVFQVRGDAGEAVIAAGREIERRVAALDGTVDVGAYPGPGGKTYVRMSIESQ